MGFLQDIKVYLSTNQADLLDDGMGSATWNLGTKINNINPLYKLKLKCTNVHIPDTFERVSRYMGNDSLTIVYNDAEFDSDNIEGVNQINDCVNRGHYYIYRASPVNRNNILDLIKDFNQQTIKAFRNRRVRWVPLLCVSSPDNQTNGRITVSLCQIRITCIMDAQVHTRFPGMLLDPTSDNELSIMILELFARNAVENQWQLPIAANTEYGGLLERINFKILTEFDTPGTIFGKEDVSLSSVLGFNRMVTGPVTRKWGVFDSANTRKRQDLRLFPYVDHVNGDMSEYFMGTIETAPSCADMSGTRFISVGVPDMGVSNIDAYTKSFGRTIACVPVMPSDSSNSVVYDGNQDNPYITLSQESINSFKVELRSDNGILMRMCHDWFIEFNVRIEEPDETDAYRGLRSQAPYVFQPALPGYDNLRTDEASMELDQHLNYVDRDERREAVRRYR